MSRLINQLEEAVIGFLLASMSVLSFVQVVLRYGFSIGISWAYEAVTYMFAWMVILGMSYGVKVGAHLGVDVLVKRLPPAGYRSASVLGGVLCMLYSGLLFAGSWVYVVKIRSIGVEAEDIPIQKWIIFTVLPLGFALLLLRFGQATWRVVTGRQSGLGLADEVKDSLQSVKRDSAASGTKRP